MSLFYVHKVLVCCANLQVVDLHVNSCRLCVLPLVTRDTANVILQRAVRWVGKGAGGSNLGETGGTGGC